MGFLMLCLQHFMLHTIATAITLCPKTNRNAVHKLLVNSKTKLISLSVETSPKLHGRMSILMRTYHFY